MKSEDLTVEDMHRYLSLSWYGYSCCDKEQLTEIIQDELNKPYNMSRDKLKLHIKRRCQAETGR
ncbi:MAG: hypothetical protein IJI42_09300 [Methanobrevibacter sp.]|uniref:Uncharacterized protein n=1 Tax=Methanobrevibacter millerae TaxID=230361 RepID=A0A8T3VLS1_9EURY|nr:hypothetical protein [Methanobrevibacter millerae]MBE6505620.1 hypothetical protein [Methanobrevibacter millerae]MBQ6351109.1 hypothetical protein [Methanobrevibacter sp.]